jgi:hypothetical protein
MKDRYLAIATTDHSHSAHERRIFAAVAFRLHGTGHEAAAEQVMQLADAEDPGLVGSARSRRST